MLLINRLPHAVLYLSSWHLNMLTQVVSLLSSDYMNSVGYIVGVLKIHSPSYMYAAVAYVILAWHLHVNAVYMYYIVPCVNAACTCSCKCFTREALAEVYHCSSP